MYPLRRPLRTPGDLRARLLREQPQITIRGLCIKLLACPMIVQPGSGIPFTSQYSQLYSTRFSSGLRCFSGLSPAPHP
jgi:hypothetical protein